MPARPVAVVVVALAFAALAAGPAAARVRWRAPVSGPVVARFAYSPSRPFAAGQRRGVELAARGGEPVLAPCAGVVAYAGRVPGFARGLSVRCGRLTATVLGLGGVAVRRGAYVLPGTRLGVAGARGSVRLGARVTASRFAYRDPLALLGAAPRPPLPVVGRRVGPRAPALRAPRPVRLPVTVPAARVAAPVRAPAVSPVAWAGLALLAAATPVGGLAVRRRRRRSARATGGTVARAAP